MNMVRARAKGCPWAVHWSAAPVDRLSYFVSTFVREEVLLG